MKILSRVLDFLGYTVVFTVMPLVFSVLLSVLFGYPHDWDGIMTDLFIVDTSIAVVIMRDTNGVNRLPANCVRYFMMLFISVTSFLYGALRIRRGDGQTFVAASRGKLILIAGVLFLVIVVMGIFTQIYFEYKRMRAAEDSNWETREGNGLTVAGDFYYSTGHYEEAVEKYTEAIARHPETQEAHIKLGNTLYKLQRYEEAYKELRAAMELALENPAYQEKVEAAKAAREAVNRGTAAES